jgi:hypothetical protein
LLLSSPVREVHFAEGVMREIPKPTWAIKGDDSRCNIDKRDVIGNERG